MNEKLIEKYRYINTEHDWYDYVIEHFIEKVHDLGISIDKKDVQFTGFYSQGDGASFCGAFDEQLFMEMHDLAEQYPAAYYLACINDLHISPYRHPSMYSHESAISFEVHSYALPSDGDDLREVVLTSMIEQFEHEVEDLKTEVTDICRGYMKDLYNELREEYEHLTSDEAVWEAIQCNGLEEEHEDCCTC
jgi:hypothetical protein